MNVEHSSVNFGDTRIDYVIQRSQRVKTVALAVDPREGVILTADNVVVDRLDSIVLRKAPWIVEKLKRNSEIPPPPPEREYVSGESFRYLGKQYRLKVKKHKQPQTSISLSRGWFVVIVPMGLDAKPQQDVIRKELVTWYRQHAVAKIPERVALWAKKLETKDPTVLIRGQQKRWGSCDAKGNLRFNWRIMQAPIALVDYVVAHELTHLFHPNHTVDFWSLLGKIMPDYEQRREALREFGSQVEW